VVGNVLGLIYSMILGLFLEILSKTSKNLNEDKQYLNSESLKKEQGLIQTPYHKMLQLTLSITTISLRIFYCAGNNNFDKAINLDIGLMYRRMSI